MEDLHRFFDRPKLTMNFGKVRIGIASPEKIRSWSYGEVKKPETINYRTFKPERDGLFCARIFGPIKDWECTCGKYKRMKYRGIVCDKCGVEVIQSKVRRDRLGHIELASPVSHVWFLKALPSRIGHLLDMTLKDLEKVLYFESYVVINPEDTPLKPRTLLTEEEYRQAVEEYGPGTFDAQMGAEAIKRLLEEVDLHDLSDEIREGLRTTRSKATKAKLIKRWKIVEAFRKSNNQPEWMILDVLPVLPPELRPLVPLDGGRFATSDLNDLYRRVINRNNRLKRLLELRAPDVIVKNEKRMLQEAVDALFDNGRRGRVIRGANRRPLKSLSDMLKGKQGRFRQNLLGKRVDYSGRSVIVVGPHLKMNQCGLPKKMALELFKPFIFNRLEARGLVTSIKAAKKMVESGRREVWDALEEVITEHPVLLNRAPTLHRLGIQAFDPVLVEGRAIQLHPLVCTAFNADFDGDQMAVHVPLSVEAQVEARVLMLSVNNILAPSNGRPITVPTQDMVLGLYYMTIAKEGARGEGMVFSDVDEVRRAYEAGFIELHAMVKVRVGGRLRETTVGRALFSECLPSDVDFEMANQLLTKKVLVGLIGSIFRAAGRAATVAMLDRIKELGFESATRAGVSICIDDMNIPGAKETLLKDAFNEVKEVTEQYNAGLITDGERYNKVIDIWSRVNDEVTAEMMNELGAPTEWRPHATRQFNSIYMMSHSGARGSTQQIRQLAGMRGLMAKPSGEIIENPITANFREGLTVLQYFISTHGARKGLADTALKTANSGYLTRRLVDVAQDSIIVEGDCGTLEGIEIHALTEGGEIIEPLYDRILGRVAAEDIIDPYTNEMLVEADQEIREDEAEKIVGAGLTAARVRSPLTCEAPRGMCAMCYGRDLARGRMVELGTAVGVIAAQSIGEPGTQLTMRTFHIGGAASSKMEQTTQDTKVGGIVRFKNIDTLENRDKKTVAMNRGGRIVIEDDKGHPRETYDVVYGATLLVKDGARVEPKTVLVEWDPFSIVILSEVAGKVVFEDIIEGRTMREEVDEVTGLSRRVIIDSSDTALRPRIVIKDARGREAGSYLVPFGASIQMEEGEEVIPGDVLGKIPRETTKTQDITGGLPRVAELFEARKPKEHAVISEINGVVRDGGYVRGNRRMIVVGEDGTELEYVIPRGKHVNVQEGDYVRVGEPLMDGALNPHDILRVLGPRALQEYLVDEVQKVYQLQGVSIHDKHIEVIVRQMMRRVLVEDPGDTELLQGEQVDRFRFAQANEDAMGAGQQPAEGEPLLLGITKASLNTDSFISAASFQETTRVLTEASIAGKLDDFVGLKENVIMGRLIPAGTGFPAYRDVKLRVEEPAPVGLVEAIHEVAAVDEQDA
ncbi:MAG: DNA-directed RNA polymerase subunit beta' [Nitrospirota bacterium]